LGGFTQEIASVQQEKAVCTTLYDQTSGIGGLLHNGMQGREAAAENSSTGCLPESGAIVCSIAGGR